MQTTQRRMLDLLESKASMTEQMLGNKKRVGQTPTLIMSYVYGTFFSTVAAVALATNTGVQNTIQVAGDSDFFLVYQSAVCFNQATQSALTAPYARLLVTDNSSQRATSNIPLNVTMGFGSGGYPYLLQEPKLLPASTNLLVTFYNDATVGPIVMDAQVCFGGYRVFY